MSDDNRQATHGSAQQFAQGRPLYLGTVVQFALRLVIVVFVAVTLLSEPPSRHQWICVAILCAYAAIVGCWSVWALRSGWRASSRTRVTLLGIAADVATLSALSVLTGITSPEVWTSDLMADALFLIPLIAAAQLDPVINAVMAIPTVAAFLVTCAVTKTLNEEPWTSIALNTFVLAALFAASVAVSNIQRDRVVMIVDLAEQRTRLLQDMLGLEKRERQDISERLHDGALQYVLVARQDMDDLRDGSADAVDRVDAALVECSGLLRDVVRELHPAVLARSGLKAAVETLAAGIGTRNGLVVNLDARTWPDDVRTGADHVLYGVAREALTNVVKHARAENVWVELELRDGRATLRIADDGVGISEAKLSESLENGHIGMASTRTKVLAAEGQFDVRSTSPGTEVTVSIPLDVAAVDSTAELAAL
ncbi:sensor histidine kinase [Mycobacterium sp. ITM-2016-00318]|uniref:sensor histidine kinase n=1 Tax=Mycobacterium sp. ITM-2016-00318 TaxID=2099693 RepID=UPI000CF9E37C|nr:ATP-binding protein [Mycobacterium sp. ITM-2016-00318]WNG95317.1 ATP-binding protein [Mycobacterium sp. ITM-2016-00318]